MPDNQHDTLRLSRTVRAKLFNREAPAITGDGKCPVEPGHVHRLSENVSIQVNKILRTKKGGWSLRYELHDRRHDKRLIRRTPGIHREDFDKIREGFDEHGYPAEPTPDAIRQAGRESGYTSTPASAISDAGEAVDELTQRRYSKDAETTDELREQARREQWDLSQRLLSLREEARARGVDISHHERVIADRISRIEKAVRGRVA